MDSLPEPFTLLSPPGRFKTVMVPSASIPERLYPTTLNAGGRVPGPRGCSGPRAREGRVFPGGAPRKQQAGHFLGWGKNRNLGSTPLPTATS